MKSMFRLLVATVLILCVPLIQVAVAAEPSCAPCAAAQGNSTITITREAAAVQQAIVASYKGTDFRALLQHTRDKKLSVMSSSSYVSSVAGVDGILVVPVSDGETKGYLYNVPETEGHRCAISFLTYHGTVTATISDDRGVRSMDFQKPLPDPDTDGNGVGLLALDCDDECNAAFALGCFALCGWAGFTPGGALCALVCALGAANSCRCICHNIGCPPPPIPPVCGSAGLPDCE